MAERQPGRFRRGERRRIVLRQPEGDHAERHARRDRHEEKIDAEQRNGRDPGRMAADQAARATVDARIMGAPAQFRFGVETEKAEKDQDDR